MYSRSSLSFARAIERNLSRSVVCTKNDVAKVSGRALSSSCMRMDHFPSSPLYASMTARIYKVSPVNNTNLIQSRSMASQRHKKIVKLAKGYRGRANRCYTVAKHRVMKARQYAYRDRKVKKRVFRTLWIQRINASARMYGTKYGNIINGMLVSGIKLNRKVLSDIAVTEPLSFRSVVEVVKKSVESKKLAQQKSI